MSDYYNYYIQDLKNQEKNKDIEKQLRQLLSGRDLNIFTILQEQEEKRRQDMKDKDKDRKQEDTEEMEMPMPMRYKDTKDKKVRRAFLSLKVKDFIENKIQSYKRENVKVYRGHVYVTDDYKGENSIRIIDFLIEMEEFGYTEIEVVTAFASFSNY